MRRDDLDPAPPPAGRRAEHKRRTRSDIEAAAMSLFLARGYDAVTVAEVARAAHVSVATIFNYFPAKQDLFFDEVPAQLAALVSVIGSCLPGASLLAALQDQLPSLLTAGRPEAQFAEIAPFHLILAGSGDLLRREQQIHWLRRRRLAAALAEHLHPDYQLTAEIAAAQYIAAEGLIAEKFRAALADGRPAAAALRDLQPVIDEAFRVLESGLGQLRKAARS